MEEHAPRGRDRRIRRRSGVVRDRLVLVIPDGSPFTAGQPAVRRRRRAGPRRHRRPRRRRRRRGRLRAARRRSDDRRGLPARRPAGRRARRSGEACGRRSARALADDPERLAKAMVDRADLTMELPVTVGDYVDGYAGLHHATNLGRILRPGRRAAAAQLAPPPRRLPRAVGDDRGVGAPTSGARRARSWSTGRRSLAPSAQLDIELELGAIVGVGNEPGEPIPVGEADAPPLRLRARQRLVGPGHPGLGVPAARARSWASRSPRRSRRGS